MRGLLLLIISAIALTANASQTITITVGGTYSYNINNDGTSADCIDVATTAPVIITNSNLTVGSGIGINNTVSGTNVTVKFCTINCTNKNGFCIFIQAPAGLIIKRCSFNGTPSAGAGAMAGFGVQIQGTGAPSSAVIDVQQNYFFDVQKAVFITYVHSDPNVTVAYNQVGMTSLYGHADQIALYQSWGTGTSLINIAQNFVAVNPEEPQAFGPGDYGGINACDINCTNVLVNGNYVENGGAYGIAFSYASSSGSSQATSNIVVGVGDTTLPSTYPTFGFGAVIGSGPDTEVYNGNGNYVIWYDGDGTYYTNYWSYIVGPEAGTPFVFPTTYPSGDVQWPWSLCSLTEEQSLYSQWQQQMSTAGILIGTGANPGITYPAAADFP